MSENSEGKKNLTQFWKQLKAEKLQDLMNFLLKYEKYVLGLVLWHIKHCRLLMSNSFLYILAVLFQTIQFIISTQFQCKNSSISNKSISIDRILSGATTLGQSAPGSDGNEEVLRIPRSSRITETSRSNCLVSNLGYLLGESYPSAEI